MASVFGWLLFVISFFVMVNIDFWPGLALCLVSILVLAGAAVKSNRRY